MRHTILAALALSASVLPAAENATAAKPAEVAPAVSAKAEPVKLPPLAGDELRECFVRMGFDIGIRSPLTRMSGDYEMTAEEVDAFLAGVRSAMLGQKGAALEGALGERFDVALRERRTLKVARINNAFLAKVDADKSVVRTASGLRYQVVKAGDPATKPTATSTVTCRYHGTLADGTVFDSTRDRNNEPVTFALNEVIPGWTEGLQLIAKGGVIKLWIPAGLAYGDQDAGPIPAGSVLEFEVELVDVK